MQCNALVLVLVLVLVLNRRVAIPVIGFAKQHVCLKRFDETVGEYCDAGKIIIYLFLRQSCLLSMNTCPSPRTEGIIRSPRVRVPRLLFVHSHEINNRELYVTTK